MLRCSHIVQLKAPFQVIRCIFLLFDPLHLFHMKLLQAVLLLSSVAVASTSSDGSDIDIRQIKRRQSSSYLRRGDRDLEGLTPVVDCSAITDEGAASPLLQLVISVCGTPGHAPSIGPFARYSPRRNVSPAATYSSVCLTRQMTLAVRMPRLICGARTSRHPPIGTASSSWAKRTS